MVNKLSILNKQREIRWILHVLGWSINRFASRYMIDTNDYDVDESEIIRFQEKVKKQLTRVSVSDLKIQALDDYLSFLMETDEYHKAHQREVIKALHPLTGFMRDYQLILDAAETELQQQVLAVAAGYALSLGAACSFHVIAITEKANSAGDHRYLVIWEGDKGYQDRWQPALCEVVQPQQGRCYVASADLHFTRSLAFIESVESYHAGRLIIVGYRYAKDDSVHYPSLKYRVILEQSSTHRWRKIEEYLIKKEVHTSCLMITP